MKLFFMKQDAVDFMKHNMERLYTHYFQDNDNSWMEQEYGSNPFAEFMDVPDFELSDIESGTIGEVDFGTLEFHVTQFPFQFFISFKLYSFQFYPVHTFVFRVTYFFFAGKSDLKES